MYDRRLSVLELNLSQASLLAYVVDLGPATQTRIAQHLSLGRAATGALVDQLERKSLVERRPDPEDRRVWLVAPTSLGTDAAGKIEELDRTLRAELRDGISREDRQLPASLINRLRANVDEAIARTDSPTPTDRQLPRQKVIPRT
ncbi:MAG: MarR family transcriptional regulator [Ilumatobacteraceae bacterium]